MGWQSIETAPNDGTQLTVRRVFGGHEVWRGEASFHEMSFGPLFDPISGEQFAQPETVMGWGYPVGHEHFGKRVPEPTHWQPQGR